jgi:hypothetical protein
VAGRALAFADPAVIQLIRRSFIPVAGDDWYERRREDDQGRFFRSVADQGPRKGKGGDTRQGIYLLSAGGKLLAYRNHQDPAVIQEVLRRGLAEFERLPADQRRPGAVRVPDRTTIDAHYDRQPPKDGLILNVYSRILDRSGEHDYCRGTCTVPGGDRAAHDHLWLTAEEWRILIPASAKVGQEIVIPRRVVYRLARFHLVDNTRGEPPFWDRAAVRRHDLKLRVAEVTNHGLTLRLEGSILITTSADLDRAERGFDARLSGVIRYDIRAGRIDRLDVVAIGDHWGEGPFTRSARPGRTPLGVAFELAWGDRAADRVPPQGARDLREYWRAE